MAAATNEPTLSNEELEEILSGFAMTDSAGNAPSDPEWIPTYRLRAAAAEAWRRKAGKASELQSTDLDGDRMSANQIFEHCQRMIRTYSSSASVTIGGSGQ